MVLTANNVIQKVARIVSDKMDGDTIMLIDSHLPNALKTVCKFISDNKPEGHEKLLLAQSIAISNVTLSQELEQKRFSLSGFTYPFIVPDSKFHNLTLVKDSRQVEQLVIALGPDIPPSVPAQQVNITYTGAFIGSGTVNTVLANISDIGYVRDAIRDSFLATTVISNIYDIDIVDNKIVFSDKSVRLADPTLEFVILANNSNIVPATSTSGTLSSLLYRGYNTSGIAQISLSSTHGVCYYYIESPYVYINYGTSAGINQEKIAPTSILVTHYIYATITQFPEELEDLLVMELVRIIQNEPNKQQIEKK